MKIKSITLLALCVSAYLILFYGAENIGINALVLCVITLILSWIDNPYSLLPKKVQLVTVLYLLSGFAVAWHATFWSITSLYITYGIFVAQRYEPQSSILIACYNGIKSIKLGFLSFVTLPFMGLSEGYRLLWQKAGLVVKPLLITLLFYILYAFANPDFGFDFELNLSFLDKINFLFFIHLCFALVLFTPLFMDLSKLFDFKWVDLHRPNDLIDSKTSSAEELSFENQQAVILFFMLNILIGTFLVFNFLQTTIPTAPSTFSKQVHQGVYSVILSVFVASGVIFYYFRGDLNFYPKNQQLRLLAYFWLILNTCLILFTTHKNSIYVLNLGLTHKRIWVYVGLLFTFIGLIYAFIKIRNLKTNWFLLRHFGWIFFVFMIGYSLLDWDKIITAYNLQYAKKIDFSHLHGLGRTNIPQLLEYDSVMAKIPKEQRPQDYFPYPYDEFDMDKLLTNDWRSDNLDQIGLRNYLENRDRK